MHQFVTLDRIDPTVGKRHEGASGDQGLQHVFVVVIEIVRSEFGQQWNSSRRFDVSSYSSSVVRHGAPEELRPVLSGR